jgi:hypothetical protein
MKTITVQIGNSDDKLTQKEWCDFARSIDDLIRTHASQVHFSGASHSLAWWQNAAWVFEMEEVCIEWFKQRLAIVRGQYKQESLAWTEGSTSLI